MVMLKEEIILKKLFVALDDRTLDLEKVGQHLAGLPTSYALESLEEAMESYTLFIEQQQQRKEEFALFAEQQQQRQEEREQREKREREEYLASIPTPTAVLSNALWELLIKLAIFIPIVLASCLILVPWWW